MKFGRKTKYNINHQLALNYIYTDKGFIHVAAYITLLLLCMSQIQFFLVKFPTMRALSLVKCPLPRDFLGVKCPTPRAEVTKPRLISGNLKEVFNTAISIIFCIPVQRLRLSFCFLCT